MHELSIALSILDIAAEEAQRRGGATIASIHLKVGVISGVVRDALESAFQVASETCGMPDCKLVISEIPVTIDCTICGGARNIVSIQDFSCCECGTPSSQTISGRELEVTAMEI